MSLDQTSMIKFWIEFYSLFESVIHNWGMLERQKQIIISWLKQNHFSHGHTINTIFLIHQSKYIFVKILEYTNQNKSQTIVMGKKNQINFYF